MKDRRATRRYGLSLPVVVRASFGGKAASQEGKTRDVSTRGVYLLVDRALHHDGDLDLTMTLPGDVIGGDAVFVRAVGRVVRVEERTQDGSPRIGIGAMIRRYEIARNDPFTS